RDDERTVHGEFVTARVAGAVDRRDDGLRDATEHVRGGGPFGGGRRARQRLGKIHTRTEGRARAREDDDVHLVVGIGAPQFLLQRLPHGTVDRVAAVGTVEGEDRDGTVALDEHRRVVLAHVLGGV